MPVQQQIILGKTSNPIKFLWDESKLKKINQDKRRKKAVQGRVKTPRRAEGSADGAGHEEQNPASYLPDFSCPVPTAKEEEGSPGSAGKDFLCKPACRPTVS